MTKIHLTFESFITDRNQQLVNEWGASLKPYKGYYRKELVSDSFDIWVESANYDPKGGAITFDCELSTLDGELKQKPFGITIAKGGAISGSPCPECKEYLASNAEKAEELETLVKQVNKRQVASESTVNENMNPNGLVSAAMDWLFVQVNQAISSSGFATYRNKSVWQLKNEHGGLQVWQPRSSPGHRLMQIDYVGNDGKSVPLGELTGSGCKFYGIALAGVEPRKEEAIYTVAAKQDLLETIKLELGKFFAEVLPSPLNEGVATNYLHAPETNPGDSMPHDSFKTILNYAISRFHEDVQGELERAGFEVLHAPNHDNARGAYFAGEAWRVKYNGHKLYLAVGDEGDYLVALSSEVDIPPARAASVAQLKAYVDKHQVLLQKQEEPAKHEEPALAESAAAFHQTFEAFLTTNGLR